MKKKTKTNKKALEVRDGLITRTALLNLAEDLYETKTELEKAKDYTDNIIKSLIDTLLVVDPDGRIKTINPATAQLLGYKEEELIGKPVAIIFAEEEEEEEEEVSSSIFKGTRLKKLIEEGTVRDYDMKYRTKKGEVIPVSFSGSVMRDKNGNLVGIVGIARDMREIKRLMEKENELAAAAAAAAAAATRESDERYKQITETVGEWIWETDAQGLYTYSSPVAEDIMGYKPAEIIGIKRFYDLFEPKTMAELKKKIFKQLSDKKVLRNMVIEYMHKKGHGVFLQMNCLPVLDKKGNLSGIRGANNDISSQINAENALRETHTLLNAIPEGIVMMDLKGRITEVSNITLEIMGADSRTNFIGKDFLFFVPRDETKKIKEVLRRTIAEGLAQNVEVRLTKRDQSQFTGEISTTLIQESDGKPKAFMAIIRDISQRKQMEQKLIHTERMAGLGGIATGIAHEINQPLNTISLSLENILLEIKTKKTIDEKYLQDKSDKIFENILRIGNIIDHIRVFSRDQDDYILTSFDINDSIKNAMSMVSEQYKHKAIDIKISLDKKIQLILGNTYKFEQVILNLLTNAKDAMEEKGKTLKDDFQKVVNIRTYQDDQTLPTGQAGIYVEVKDNGIGINANEIDKIMLPFYSTKDAGRGTGLGLSISFGIIKEMGGNIEIQSEPLIGTTVRIILPVVH